MTVTVNLRGRRFEAYASAKHRGKSLRARKSGFAAYEDAEAWGRLRESQLAQGVSESPTTSRTLQDLCESAHESLWAQSRSAKSMAATLNSVLKVLGPDRNPATLKTRDIDSLVKGLRSLGNSETTIKKKLTVLGRALRWAKEREWVATVPTFPQIKADQGRDRWATEAEGSRMSQLLRDAGHPDYADLVTLLADTGLRVSEGIGLAWSDLLPNGSLQVRAGSTKITGASGSKSKKSRVVPMTQRVRDVLEGRRGHDVCGPFTGLKQNTLNYLWRKAKGSMGLAEDREFVPHCLRHGVATRLTLAGVNAFVIKEWLGHQSLETTLRYAHLGSRDLHGAAQVLEDSSA